MAWTIFEYLYRDAGNFKAFGSIALEGRVKAADREFIRAKLDGGEYFIAEQVGVPPLYDKLYRWSEGPTESDHCWHEFVGFRELPIPAQPTSAVASAREFIARFAAIEDWDEQLSPHFSITNPARP